MSARFVPLANFLGNHGLVTLSLLGTVAGIAGFTWAIAARFVSLERDLDTERKLRDKDRELHERALDTERALRKKDMETERTLRERDMETERTLRERDMETENARRERDVAAAKQETADRLLMLGFAEEYVKYQKKLGLQASVATDNPDE